jgi:hypothetical protein
MERDNVRPAYLRELRTAVLNHMAEHLDEEAASGGWVGSALEHKDISPEAVGAVIAKRYGERVVIADPSDPEGTKIAVSRGYAVIQAGSFNRAQWRAIRESGAALPAGQVTPSPKPYSDNPDARVRNELPRSDWTPAMERIVAFTELIGERLTGQRPRVLIINDSAVPARATYGRHPGGGQFEYNLAHLGRAWFEQASASEPVLDLILHETGHHIESDHLSAAYYRALTKYGARLAGLALTEPELFE